MRSKGFFCFSLALVFALTAFAISGSGNIVKEKILEAKTIAMSLEQASLKRFEIEQNADKAIKTAMEKSIREGKESPEAVKQSVNAALWQLFESEKKQSREKIEFYSTVASKTQYARIGFSEKNKPLEKKDLEENSKTIVLGIKAEMLGIPVSAFAVEYSLTGGLLKNKTVFALVEKPKSSQLFMIPVDYSNKTLVIK